MKAELSSYDYLSQIVTAVIMWLLAFFMNVLMIPFT